MAKRLMDEQVEAAMAALAELNEKQLRTVKRRVGQRISKLEEARIESDPSRRCISLYKFDEVMARYIPGYESGIGMTSSAIVQASRVLEQLNINAERAAMVAEWYSTQEWYCQSPTQRRAINNLGPNILTAERWRRYKLEQEERLEMLCDEKVTKAIQDEEERRPGQRVLPAMGEGAGK